MDTATSAPRVAGEHRLAVFPEQYRVTFENRPIPEIAADQILVENDFTLISPGTELAMFTGTHSALPDPGNKWAKYPFYPGYAATGRVTKKGSAVARVQVGERILCMQTHASHAVIRPDEELWLRVPENVNPRHALLSIFAEISYTSVLVAHAKPENVLVLGAGIIGNLAAQLFKLQGARKVIVADINPQRIETARRCGLPHAIDTRAESLAQGISRLTANEGVSIIVEATGLPALVVGALEAVGRRGEVILLGSPRGTVNVDAYKLIHKKGAVVTGAHYCIFPAKESAGSEHSCEEIAGRALELIGNGELICAPLITHAIAPERIQEAYNGLINEPDKYLGVVVEWRPTSGTACAPGA